MILRFGVRLAEDGRLEEVALVEAVAALAAGQDLGAALLGVVDQVDGLVQRLLLEHRADLDARLQAVAQLQALGELDGRLGELLLHILVDVEPARGDADLAVVAELADDGGLGADFGIGVGKDDERGVAAQLQAQPLHLVGRSRASAACRPRSSR